MDDEYSSLYHATQTFCCDWSCETGQFEADVTRFRSAVQSQCAEVNPLTKPLMSSDISFRKFKGSHFNELCHKTFELCLFLVAANLSCSLVYLQPASWVTVVKAYMHSAWLPYSDYTTVCEVHGGICSWKSEWLWDLLKPTVYTTICLPAYARSNTTWTLHLN